MWEQQLEVLADASAVELPGHGDEPRPPGPVTIETIARTVLERIPGRFSFVGVSIGGMVGQWLGVNAPERVERLVLACTGPKLGAREDYLDRAALVRREGVEPVVDGARDRWFTEQFRDDERALRILADLRLVDRGGYAACCEAVGNFDFRSDLHRLAVPTLVLFGRDDPVTTPEVRQALAAFDPVEIPGAHLANVESPREFNDRLRSFL